MPRSRLAFVGRVNCSLNCTLGGCPVAATTYRSFTGVLKPQGLLSRARPRPSPIVAASNEQAKNCGVQDGMGLAAALAVIGELQVLSRNEAAEREALENIAQWAGQFTAMVSIVESGTAGLVLEIGGSLRLFGDDPKIVGRQLRSGLTELGFSPIIAAAPTPTAAWWLARSGIQTLIRDVVKMRRRLSKIPIDGMDIKASTLDGLWGIGVRTVGDCENFRAAMPPGGLVRTYINSLIKRWRARLIQENLMCDRSV